MIKKPPSYAEAVMSLVGIENCGGGPADGPLEALTYKEGFTDFPTDAEVKIKLQELTDAFNQTKYKDQRAEEYPRINDLVVALWERVIEGKGLDACDAIELKRQAIKNKYPKS